MSNLVPLPASRVIKKRAMHQAHQRKGPNILPPVIHPSHCTSHNTESKMPLQLTCAQCQSLLLELVTPPERESISMLASLKPHGPYTARQFDVSHMRDSANVRNDMIIDAVTCIIQDTCTNNSPPTVATPTPTPSTAPKPPTSTAAAPLVTGVKNRSLYQSRKYPDGSSSIFFSLTPPGITLQEYISRLVKYLRVSRSVFVVSLVYLDRIRVEDDLLCLSYLNVHRLLTTSLLLSCKYLEDETYRNSAICRIGGVPSIAEMNMLEKQFLRRLNWNCSVSCATFKEYEFGIFGDEA